MIKYNFFYVQHIQVKKTETRKYPLYGNLHLHAIEATLAISQNNKKQNHSQELSWPSHM